MANKILCFVFYCFGALQTKAQSAAEKEMRIFYHQLDSSLVASFGACKNAIAAYKTELSRISVASLDAALQEFHKANGAFKNTSGICKGLALRIAGMDSVLKAQEINSKDAKDSVDLVHSLAYLKNKASGYKEIKLQFRDTSEKALDPFLAVHSLSSSIVPQNSFDTTFRLFVITGAVYKVSVSKPGYNTYSAQLSGPEKDTAYTIRMQQAVNNAAASTTATGESNEQKMDPFLWIAIPLAILLLLLLSRLLLQKRKEQKKVLLHPFRPEMEVLPQEEKRAKVLEIYPPMQHESDNRYFLSEIMMTAGPRKKPMNQPGADKDLGEDVCGFITSNKNVLMWLLDGTSDFYCLKNPETGHEYFSSRLLAQSIGRKLKTRFQEADASSIAGIMSEVIEEVKEDWMQAIQLLPPGEKEFLRSNITAGNFPECAATILVATLSLDGSLMAYRSGDCKMFLYGGDEKELTYLPSSLAGKNEKSNDRIFFRLVVTDEGTLSIASNEPLYEVVEEENIRAIISISDGVGRETEAVLKTGFTQNPHTVREALIHHVQGTEDDKSFCMIEIKEKTKSSERVLQMT